MKVSNATVSSPAALGIVARRNKTVPQLVPQVPVEFFTDANGILPRLRDDITVKDVVQRLKAKQNAIKGHWLNLEVRPSASPVDKGAVLRGIQHITDTIQEASGVSTPPTLVFMCKPESTMVDDTKSDVCGTLASAQVAPTRSGKPRWIDVAVPGEFAESAEDHEDVDNWTNVIWSMTQIMQEDARRRFVVAFSIEGADMRMWLASRSEVLVSLPFNWITKYDLAVEFFLRLMYADEADLGWDPTMQRLSPRDHVGDVEYLIACADAQYRTTRLISDVGAEALCGRGTRVWEVREVRENGEEAPTPLVLKDAWVDAGREREGAILAAIRSAAKALPDMPYDFDKYFVVAKAYGDVYIGDAADDTHVLIRGRRFLDGMEDRPLVVEAGTPGGTESRSSAGVFGAWQSSDDGAPRPVISTPKIHHRIVFTEVGTLITQVESLAMALFYISHVAKALYILHRCGWVHRDISLGNILIVNGVGKLTDVEYAKHEGDTETHDSFAIGTSPFKSLEVEQQRYRYAWMDLTEEPLDKGAEDIMDIRSSEEESAALRAFILARVYGPGPVEPVVPEPRAPPAEVTAVETKREVVVPFKYNPLHDLESLTWVAIWLLVCSKFLKPANSGMSDDEWASTLRCHARLEMRLFREGMSRYYTMTVGNSLFHEFSAAPPQLKIPVKYLNAAKVALYRHFLGVEKRRTETEAQVPFKRMLNVHKDIIGLLGRAAVDLATSGNDLKVNVAAYTQRMKRARDPAGDDGGPAPAPAGPPPRTPDAEQDGGEEDDAELDDTDEDDTDEDDTDEDDTDEDDAARPHKRAKIDHDQSGNSA